MLRSKFKNIFALVILVLPLYKNVALAETTILVLGDSLSAAYKLPEEKGWVNLLHQELTQKKYAINLVNASISGITTVAGLQILPNALETHKPDIVILELGANDGLQGKPIAYISQNLSQLIEMAKSSGAEVLLLGIRLPPNFGSKYTEPFFQQFFDLASKHQVAHVPFLLEGVAGNPELMMSDGLHSSAAGQVVVLRNVLPSVLTMVDEIRSTDSQ